MNFRANWHIFLAGCLFLVNGHVYAGTSAGKAGQKCVQAVLVRDAGSPRKDTEKISSTRLHLPGISIQKKSGPVGHLADAGGDPDVFKFQLPVSTRVQGWQKAYLQYNYPFHAFW